MTHRHRTRERGQVIVLFGLGIIALLAMIGGVVDGGNIYVQRRTVQAAADAGALAGANAVRTASSSTSLTSLQTTIRTFAQANAFGPTPTVQCAYFVTTSGSPAGNIINTDCSGQPSGAGTAAVACGSPASIAVPCNAAGVHVDARVSFHTWVVGFLGLYNINADGHATSIVGVLSGADVRNAPLIVCGGGGQTGYDALKFTTQTPIVATTTPGVLAATPSGGLPTFNNPNLTEDQLLVTPAAGAPPAYVTDPSKDGTLYYIKGQQISTSNGSTCGASGFHGAAATVQPTPYIQNVANGTPGTINGQTGNSVPQISQRVSTAGACPGGTNPNSWNAGSSGCVMILPVVNGSDGLSFYVQAWAAFYVWCTRGSGGAGCQDWSGQYLANWPAAGGPSVNAWTWGSRGGSITTVRLTS